MLSFSKRLLSLMLALPLLWSCSNNDSKKEKQADPRIENSFQDVKPGQFLGFNQERFIGIKKSALGKEFLLQGAFMFQEPIAEVSSLKSRVVTFKEAEGSLFLMESTKGHLVTDELPSKLILAKLPIVSKNDDTIFFDFNTGMSSLFVSSDWAYTEGQGTFEPATEAVDVRHSFIDSVVYKNNKLIVRQIAQLDGQRRDSIEVKYYLEPYFANAAFEPKESGSLETMGFFEVAPQYDAETGSRYSLSTRWDTSKKITYAVSSNTPVEYQQAVADAVLYWNRAFDKPVLQVVTAPEGVTIPDYDYNLIQWVRYDEAGYAYADAQMDPFTGEIRHAQIFMTSVFAVSGEAEARRLLKDAATQANPSQAKVLGLRGMMSRPLCSRSFERKYFKVLKGLMEAGASESEYLRISRDIVREVVAHEVGHTLGLRHNFAGSLGASYTLKERDAIVQDYVANGKLDETTEPTSSLMDYQLTEESAMTGHIISSTTRILKYDRMAIQALYADKEFSAENLPVFCTDTQIDQLDCRTFDIGLNPVAGLDYALSQQKPFTELLFRNILQAKRVDEKPYFDAVSWAGYIFDERLILASLLNKETPLVQVRRNVSYYDDLDRDEILATEAELLQASLAEAGGWDRLLALPSKSDLQKLSADIDQLIAANNSSTLLNTVVFSDEERESLRQMIDLFAPKLQSAFAAKHAEFISQVAALDNSTFSSSFTQWLNSHAQNVLNSVSGSDVNSIRTVKGEALPLKLPAFSYDAETRLKLVSALATMSGMEAWRISRLRATLAQDFRGIVAKPIPDIENASAVDFDDIGAEWITANSTIYSALIYN